MVVMLHSLPITIDLGLGDEHESIRLFPLLKNVRIKDIRRPSSRPKHIYTDNNKHHTPLVMMYRAGRNSSPYQGTNKWEKEAGQARHI
jgi:hypothetical protein